MTMTGQSPTATLSRTTVLLLLLAVALIGCQEEKNAFVEPPPPAVTVSTPLQQSVTDYLEFTGTTASVGAVVVRAQVFGILQSMHFEPGTKVKKGQLLFVIDPRPYQAKVALAKGGLAEANAAYDKAESIYWRFEKAGREGAIAEAEVVNAKADRNSAKAGIEAAQAQVEQAELELNYARVIAPISGRVGRNLVDVGNLVGKGEATELTTITKYKPIYAYFHLNEHDLLQVMAVHRNKVKERGADPDNEPDSDLEIPVYLGLTNEEGYPHQGILDYAGSQVKTDTGTIELRAIFTNQGKTVPLIPGLFARLRFPVGTEDDALLVSEEAFGADQQGDFLLVVNKDNVVEKRLVKPGQVIDGLRVVNEGIVASERVIVNGLQHARPGAKVKPEEKPMRSTATPQDQTGKGEMGSENSDE